MSLVERPGRYAGGERGACLKNWDKQGIALRCCVCFPEVYELGMSYLGTAILYHLINRREDALAERCFAPGDDLYRMIVDGSVGTVHDSERVRLWSLESRRLLCDFDVLLFSFTYELSYPQFLRMLDAGGVPLLSRDRDGDDPIVLAGGGCTFNPEPIADFVDAFGIGDAEVLVDPMLNAIASERECGASRVEVLRALSETPGVYVPSFYEARFDTDKNTDENTKGNINDNVCKYIGISVREGESAPMPIVRQFAADLNDCPIPTMYPVPNIETVSEKAVIEVLRGCPQGCRFCQAGYTYRPFRERSADSIVDAAKWLIASTGLSEITLQSLTTLDHSEIERLLTELRNVLDTERVSVALPSLRMDAISRDLASRMRRPRESSLTFAIEAGSERLRDAINKRVTEEDIFGTFDAVLAAGFHKFKLYFMCGFEGETMDDIVELGELVKRIHAFARARSRRPLSLHVSQSVLVPKPRTPFQWQAMENTETTQKKQLTLKRMLKQLPSVRFNYHDTGTSQLEAFFSRGDRRLSTLLLRAHNSSEHDLLPPTLIDGYLYVVPWFDLAYECGIDTDAVIFEKRDPTIPLPWSHIATGVTDRCGTHAKLRR